MSERHHQGLENLSSGKWECLLGLAAGWGASSFAWKMYTRESQVKRFFLNRDSLIMFREKEVEHLDRKHYDALVISFQIVNALVKSILIDIGSSADIIYYDAFQKNWSNNKRSSTNIFNPDRLHRAFYHPPWDCWPLCNFWLWPLFKDYEDQVFSFGYPISIQHHRGSPYSQSNQRIKKWSTRIKIILLDLSHSPKQNNIVSIINGL